MSDPIATSILSKLTSWYDFDGNLNDAHGTNNLTTGVSVAGYEPGLWGQQLKAGSRAAGTLANQIPLTMSGSMCVGGWMSYTGSPTATSVFSSSYNVNPQNEALYANSDVSGNFYAGSWAASPTQYQVSTLGRNKLKYPLTIKANDSSGLSASSNQVISILTGGVVSGRFFVVSQWVNGVIQIWVDGIAYGTVNATGPRLSNITLFQVGNQFASSNTPCGLESVFFCDSHSLTADEVNWLYNDELGRNYAGVVTAS